MLRTTTALDRRTHLASAATIDSRSGERDGVRWDATHSRYTVTTDLYVGKTVQYDINSFQDVSRPEPMASTRPTGAIGDARSKMTVQTAEPGVAIDGATPERWRRSAEFGGGRP
ncbi:hypothetical protein GCM10009020_14110 [Natronoarchaeum mannanilyticum]|uniref:Uncharacterized protein n=1 Tax=Natronoarchaeum mannanilyticum TaxID=926360 RepID=A0AAV3T902_9EURY